jgi:hypothetical protein
MFVARPMNLDPVKHPTIDTADTAVVEQYGQSGMAAAVTCPDCGQTRYVVLRVLRQQVKRPTFTGACKPCWGKRPRQERNYRSRRNPTGRRITDTGYVALGKNAMTDEDLDLFDAMRRKGNHVLEHRWVMAKALGRALTPQENVDHMDGDKQNNDLENLRIYRTGKNEPGSCPGYGTYYHEWQMALVRIRELEGR